MLYGLSRLAYFISYLLIGYRKDVVSQNLERSFPELSQAERKSIEKRFYRQFFDMWVETIKGAAFDPKKWNKRVYLKGIEQLNSLLENGQSAILMSGHTANWEWSGSALGTALNGQMTVLYKRPTGLSTNEVILSIRERHGVKAIPKDSALRHLIITKDTPQVIGIISDQNPVKSTTKYWLNFLNQETPFYQGAEKIALSLKFPVYYAKMTRQRKGYYQIEMIQLYDGFSEVSEGEITKHYASMLESTIRENPADYLWSHRRWKYTKEEAAAVTSKPDLFIP